jgi:2-isopropylmalate synthase
MEPLAEDKLIYDWNRYGNFEFRHRTDLVLNDESLRDGLQSPSATDPPIGEKIEMLHLMEGLGIRAVDLGLPGAGPRAVADIAELALEIQRSRLRIRPNCAVRTVLTDIESLLDIVQRVGYPIEACTFIGSSMVRQYAEGWTLDRVLQLTEDAVTYAASRGLPVMYVTEDTTRADPETLRRLYQTAIRCGAKRICLADTVGHATPIGVYYLVKFIKSVIEETGADVQLDWHGHSDRGLAVPNSMMAISQGASRIHASALGIGERCGNTPMDLLLVNLKLEGILDVDLTSLPEYCSRFAHAVGMTIPPNYPVLGRDAFRTATGVHAAAIIKAMSRGADWLADRVYSGVPASVVGRRQEIEVGFMSGVSNIVYWLRAHGFEPEEKLVDEIFRAAKQRNAVLEEQEIIEIVKFHSREPERMPLETLPEWERQIPAAGRPVRRGPPPPEQGRRDEGVEEHQRDPEKREQ